MIESERLERFLERRGSKMKTFIRRALALSVSVDILSEDPPMFRISRDGVSAIVFKGYLPLNTKNSVLIANDKRLTKILLDHDGLLTPKGCVAKTVEEAVYGADMLRFPLVVKPVDGSCGIGITIGITDADAMKSAVESVFRAREASKLLKDERFIVEEMASGNDYRVLVLDGEVIACVRRDPASVVGNGRDPISGLIEAFNMSRPEPFRIRVDSLVEELLATQKIGLNDIPGEGLVIRLRRNANVSMGGTPVDQTAEISQRFKKIAVSAAKSLGLRFAGIDIYTRDIASDAEEDTYVVLEVNGNLIDYDIHEKPLVSGDGVDVSGILIERLLHRDESSS